MAFDRRRRAVNPRRFRTGASGLRGGDWRWVERGEGPATGRSRPARARRKSPAPRLAAKPRPAPVAGPARAGCTSSSTMRPPDRRKSPARAGSTGLKLQGKPQSIPTPRPTRNRANPREKLRASAPQPGRPRRPGRNGTAGWISPPLLKRIVRQQGRTDKIDGRPVRSFSMRSFSVRPFSVRSFSVRSFRGELRAAAENANAERRTLNAE
jgi:hypothetical protein